MTEGVAGARWRTATRWADAPSNPWLRPSRWIMLLLVMSVVTWRTGSVYGGGVDAVVVAKAAIGFLALSLSWGARINAYRPKPMANTFVWLLLAYVGISTFGAWTDGGLRVSGILSVRLLLVTFTLVLLVKTFPRQQLLEDLLSSFALVAVVAALTGLPSLTDEGRLAGGLPQMHSNELSLLCALPVIGLFHKVILDRAKASHALLLLTLGSALIATGSRTALLTVFLAVLVMLVQARAVQPALVVALVAVVPLLAWLTLRTEAVTSFFAREGAGEGDLRTLNSRSIAWEAALSHAQTPWTQWFGEGLAIKQVPVEGQYWDIQNIDSSWFSSLVQTGWLGVFLLVLWVLLLAWKTTLMPREPRMIFQGLLAALLFRSIPETGLIDSSPAFLTFLTLSLLAGRSQAATDTGTEGTGGQLHQRSLVPYGHGSVGATRS